MQLKTVAKMQDIIFQIIVVVTVYKQCLAKRAVTAVVVVTASLLDVLLACTPKTDLKAPDFLTMPALKTLLDWLRLQPQLWAHKLFSGLTYVVPVAQYHVAERRQIL